MSLSLGFLCPTHQHTKNDLVHLTESTGSLKHTTCTDTLGEILPRHKTLILYNNVMVQCILDLSARARRLTATSS
jgi:hypothetical protein